MGIKKLIKKALNLLCIYFTAITACYILILQLTNISDGEAAVEAKRVLFYFIASVLIAIAHTLYSIKKIHVVARVIIHYLICLFTLYVCFMLPVGMPESKIFVGIVIFTIAYAIVMGIFALFRSRLKKNREISEEYQSQFSKIRKNN